MVQQTRVVEVEGGPHVLLQRHVLVEEAVAEDVERDPRDVEAEHHQRELGALDQSEVSIVVT